MKSFIKTQLPPRNTGFEFQNSTNHVVAQPFHGGRKVNPEIKNWQPTKFIQHPSTLIKVAPTSLSMDKTIDKINGVNPVKSFKQKATSEIVRSKKELMPKLSKRTKLIKWGLYSALGLLLITGLIKVFKSSKTSKLS